jgi:hypothetical protein
MNYRLTAWQREAHDRAECPDMCPACAAIESHEPRGRGGRDLLTTEDFEETY